MHAAILNPEGGIQKRRSIGASPPRRGRDALPVSMSHRRCTELFGTRSDFAWLAEPKLTHCSSNVSEGRSFDSQRSPGPLDPSAGEPKFRELEPDVELVMPAPRARTSRIGKRAGFHERSFTTSLCAENGRGIDPCAIGVHRAPLPLRQEQHTPSLVDGARERRLSGSCRLRKPRRNRTHDAQIETRSGQPLKFEDVGGRWNGRPRNC